MPGRYRWFNHDNLNRLTNISNLHRPEQTTVFDLEDHPIRVTDANGVTVTKTYDALGRLRARNRNQPSFHPRESRPNRQGAVQENGRATQGLHDVQNRNVVSRWEGESFPDGTGFVRRRFAGDLDAGKACPIAVPSP